METTTIDTATGQQHLLVCFHHLRLSVFVVFYRHFGCILIATLCYCNTAVLIKSELGQ